MNTTTIELSKLVKIVIKNNEKKLSTQLKLMLLSKRKNIQFQFVPRYNISIIITYIQYIRFIILS